MLCQCMSIAAQTMSELRQLGDISTVIDIIIIDCFPSASSLLTASCESQTPICQKQVLRVR